MEKGNSCFLNSPVIPKNTPIKRLGLSRKRKSCGSEQTFNSKIQACSDKFPDGATDSPNLLSAKQIGTPKDVIDSDDDSRINYDEEIEILKKRISEDEEKLKTLKCNESNVNQLESLIELWKNGCKNAYLHFIKLLKEQQQENIDIKTVLTKLGVWDTMVQNFGSDCEFCLSDCSQ